MKQTRRNMSVSNPLIRIYPNMCGMVNRNGYAFWIDEMCFLYWKSKIALKFFDYGRKLNWKM